jgi:hypothetical protein
LRLRLKSNCVVVYVEKTQWRFPLLVLIPLPLLQELLQGLRIILWLMGGGMGDGTWHGRPAVGRIKRRLRGWRKEPRGSALNSLPDEKKGVRRGWVGPFLISLRHWLKLADRVVEDLRYLGPFCLVRAEFADVKIIVRLI